MTARSCRNQGNRAVTDRAYRITPGESATKPFVPFVAEFLVYYAGDKHVEVHHWSAHAAAGMGRRRKRLFQRRRSRLRLHSINRFLEPQRKVGYGTPERSDQGSLSNHRSGPKL